MRRAWPCLLLLVGCSPVTPVPRYPWVEDSRLSLVYERLTLRVDADEVVVDAWFELRGPECDRTLAFPVPLSGGQPDAFEATIAKRDGRVIALSSAPGTPSLLPLSIEGAMRSFDIFLPDGTLEGGTLHVSYRQRGRPHFEYVLASGAYWRGPIGRLRVEVVDRQRRVRSAKVEGRSAPKLSEVMTWDLLDIEPRSGATLELE